MAQGDKWQIGVAVRLPNHHFRHPSLISTTLIGAHSAGSGTLSVNDTTAPKLSLALARGDSVVLGPNSSGQSETVTVSGFSPAGGTIDVVLYTTTQYAYADGDPVLFAASALAAGWIPAQETGGRITPRRTRLYGGGERDDYAQLLEFDASADTVFNAWYLIYHDFEENPWEPAAYYRVGGRYKYWENEATATVAYFELKNGGTTFHGGSGYGLIASATAIDGWKSFNSVARPSPGEIDPDDSAQIRIVQQVGAATNRTALWLDTLYIEHAKGTTPIAVVRTGTLVSGNTWDLTIYDNSGFSDGDLVILDTYPGAGADLVEGTIPSGGVNADGVTVRVDFSSALSGTPPTNSELQVKNDGYFEFVEIPEPFDYDLVDGQDLRALTDNSLWQLLPEGAADRRTRYAVRAVFPHVTQAEWDKLQRLLHWQGRGHLLNLHPYIDDLPHVLTGFLSVRGLSKGRRHFSLALRPVELVFVEALV